MKRKLDKQAVIGAQIRKRAVIEAQNRKTAVIKAQNSHFVHFNLSLMRVVHYWPIRKLVFGRNIIVHSYEHFLIILYTV